MFEVNMLQETSEDWEECESEINLLLTDAEKTALTQHPIWSLDPPQRESYLSPTSYALGLKAYAKRVIKHNKAVKSDRAKRVVSIACDSPDYVTPPES